MYFSANLGCVGCHERGYLAPLAANIYDLATTVRLAKPALAGMTTEQYLAESILRPSAYIVPGFTDLMPYFYRDRLSHQQIEDIIAYLQARSKERRSFEAAKMMLQTTLQEWMTTLCVC